MTVSQLAVGAGHLGVPWLVFVDASLQYQPSPLHFLYPPFQSFMRTFSWI